MNKTMTLFMILLVGMLVTSCQNAPKGVEATTKAAAAVKKALPAAKTFKVKAGSQVMWTGSKIGGQHMGTLNITEGSVSTQAGKVTSGKFTIDMNSLTCTDLKAGEGKEKLEGHLKSADFFDTAKSPTATFVITEAGGGNITGNLTMKGITKSVTFPSAVIVSPQGVSVTTPDFSIDRTNWGIQYGSATFIDGLKDKAINDKVGLKIVLQAG